MLWFNVVLIACIIICMINLVIYIILYQRGKYLERELKDKEKLNLVSDEQISLLKENIELQKLYQVKNVEQTKEEYK